MRCPNCAKKLEPGFLYLRGIGASLFWSDKPDTGFLSHKGLEQIDLSRLSVADTATQAVIEASRCPGCATIVFQLA